MRKENSYTMSFFDAEYKDDVVQFGMSSGRDSDEKMKNIKLTAVETPDGNMTYKEAKLIIECKLIQVTTVSPADFLVEENKQFIVDAYAETKGYHKIVYGEITNVWVRNLRSR
jgi:flavin reductase (DIM6/NTAB) family NADH-FMN oxidoreductase RutF